MDDLQILADTLRKPEPSQQAIDDGRRRLRAAVQDGHHRTSRRRPAWFAAGLGTVAAGAAAAVVLTSGPAGVPPEPPRSPTSAQNVLLMAADSAADAPAKTGEYWHVKRVRTAPNLEPGMEPRTIETWTSRTTGERWSRSDKSRGRLVESSRRAKFELGAIAVSLDEIRALPTDPGALEKRLDEFIARTDLRTSAGTTPDPAGLRQLRFYSLVALITTAPASPDVRAAAFRAIAAHPDVRSVGEVEGGHGLRFPVREGRGAGPAPEMEARLVVDPSTGRVKRTNFYVVPGGGLQWVAPPDSIAITADWTDTLPKD